MIDFVPSDEAGAVIERVGICAVPKKDGRQRLVVDCRRVNCWFAVPPKAHLPTCAAYSRLSMPPGSTLYSGGFDLKDAFCQLELSLYLRPYVCLDDCYASLCPELARAGYTTITPRLPLFFWVGLMLSVLAKTCLLLLSRKRLVPICYA